jgi:hypothetical protein
VPRELSGPGTLPVERSLAWLLANRRLTGPGEDPIQAMTREQVVVTLSTGTGCCPATPVSASPAIGASDFLHDGRVPVGRALAVKAVGKHGSILSISAEFGARPPAPSLLRQTNHLLASLTVT